MISTNNHGGRNYTYQNDTGFGDATGGGFGTGGFGFGNPPQNKMDAFGSSAPTNKKPQSETSLYPCL